MLLRLHRPDQFALAFHLHGLFLSGLKNEALYCPAVLICCIFEQLKVGVRYVQTDRRHDAYFFFVVGLAAAFGIGFAVGLLLGFIADLAMWPSVLRRIVRLVIGRTADLVEADAVRRSEC